MIPSTSKPIEFVAPSGFQPPQLDDPSGEWDMVCSFRTKPDGKICMTKLGDTATPGYDGKSEKPETKPGYGEMSKDIVSQMSGGQAQPQ